MKPKRMDEKMQTEPLLNLQNYYPDDLDIKAIEEKPDEIIIHMVSKTKSTKCPKCGETLSKIHATHHRKIQDLPILGKHVRLDIRVHDFQCMNEACDIGAFSETFDGFLGYYSRMTERLADFVTILALNTSCESCARILQSMNIRISGDTVIRMLIKRYKDQPQVSVGSSIGIDDFAIKKRSTYGTIIVDEASHSPIAILEGRDGNSLKNWLEANKHVTTVTRDRASAYAKAVEEILPDCMQIADRFHLHQNLLEAVNNVIKGNIPVQIKIPIESSDACMLSEGSPADIVLENDSKKNTTRCG